MNELAKVKMSNATNYDFVGYSFTDVEKVEGAKVLLLSDGTSWEYVDKDWVQVEQDIDTVVKYSLYPFLMGICNIIHDNYFVKCSLSAVYKDVTMNCMSGVENDCKILISGLVEKPLVQEGDYVLIKTIIGKYLTKVITTTDTTITIDNAGLGMRISPNNMDIAVCYVSFPPQFLDTALAMLGYDLYKRADKEKRQERLGNYTYTNFEPINYYGAGTYPAELENKIKYWDKITI